MESQNLTLRYIKEQPRWDFRYFEPKYLRVEHLLNDGRYPLEPLSKHVKRIANFGAYSLCNLLKWVDEGIPYLRVTDLQEDSIKWERVLKITQEVHDQLPKSKVYPGDVLYSMAGTIGLAIVAPENLGECNSNQAIAQIQLKTNSAITPHFLAVFLNSRFGRYQSERIANGQTVLNINLGEIGKLNVPVPPREVQDRIAQIMQDAYATRHAKLSQAQHLLTGIEQHILDTLGIENSWPKDERHFLVKHSQIHRADVRYFSPLYTLLEKTVNSSRYETKTLKEVCQKITNGLTPARNGYTASGNAVLKVASLTKDWRIDWDKVSFTSKKFYDKARKAHVQDGDLLLLSASHQLDYIGRSFALVRDIPDKYQSECMAVGELVIVRVNSSLVFPDYLLACFSLRPIQALINRMTRGQSAHLYANDLEDLAIPIPPLNIQENILQELNRRRNTAQSLTYEAEALVFIAKDQVERMILGKEV